MALPKNTKKIVPDISEAVQRAAGSAPAREEISNRPAKPAAAAAKGGRPSPRQGSAVRQTLLLSEQTAERLTMAYAVEQIRRRKRGEQLDKSLFIEEMIVAWLDTNTL